MESGLLELDPERDKDGPSLPTRQGFLKNVLSTMPHARLLFLLPLLAMLSRALVCYCVVRHVWCHEARLTERPAGIEQTVHYHDFGENDISLLHLLSAIHSKNPLSDIPNNTSENLIATLDLKNNIIKLPVNAFHGLTSLTHLDLSNNNMIELPVNAFEGLTSLTQVLSNNNIIEIQSSVSLSDLYLSYDDISEILVNACHGSGPVANHQSWNATVSGWTGPDRGISDANQQKTSTDRPAIRLLFVNAFEGWTSLTHLNIEVIELTVNAFEGGTTLTHLDGLNLSNNEVIELPDNAFEGWTSLTHLDPNFFFEVIETAVRASENGFEAFIQNLKQVTEHLWWHAARQQALSESKCFILNQKMLLMLLMVLMILYCNRGSTLTIILRFHSTNILIVNLLTYSKQINGFTSSG